MLLTLKDDHKQHLSMLISQPATVLQDFCKLALEYLRKGPNTKIYQNAAQKLEVHPEAIRSAVEGLVNLLLESSKHQLSEHDFHDCVVALGFSEEHNQVLDAFYKSKSKEIHEALKQLTLDLPHYHDLEWRFEVQLASRALHHQITPLITMNFALKNRSLVTGDATSTTGKQNIILQTDPTNLVHMTQVLEAALQESRSQHARKIQRTFK